MSQTIGRKLTVGYAREATRLTAEASADVWLPFTDFDFQVRNEFITDESAVGSRAQITDEYLTKQMGEGNLSMNVAPEYVGYILYLAHGSVSSAQEATSGAYKHTYSMLNSSLDLPTGTLFYQSMKDAITNKKAAGVTVNSYEISGGANEIIKMTANFMGLSEVADGGSPTPSYSDSVALLGRDVTIKYATTYAGLSAGTELCIDTFKVSYNNNVELVQCLGDLNPSHNFGKANTVDIELTGKIHIDELEEANLNGTDLAFQIEIEDNRSAELGTSSGLQPMLRFKGNPSKVNLVTSKPVNDLVSFTLTQKVSLDIATGNYFEAYLQNEIASYTS